jgi:hypothetical protein
MSVSSLTIKIPSPYETEEYLIRQLRFLETKECRAVTPEPERIAMVRNVTQRFKQLLHNKAFFRRADHFTMEELNDIYS